MGIYAVRWAFHAPIDSPGAKFILVALAEHARDEGEEAMTCFPSIKRLCKWTAQAERTVERHLAWLVAEGWISRQAKRRRRQDDSAYFYTLHEEKVPLAVRDAFDGERRGGRKASRMTADGSASDRQVGAEYPPISTPIPAKLAPAYMDEPVIEPVNEPDAPEPLDIEVSFAAFWSAYPNKVEERGARAVFMRLVRRDDATPEALVGGARRYAQLVRGGAPQYIKSPTSWLEKGCWTDGATSSSTTTPERSVAAFEGPADVWTTVAGAKGPDWARSYLAPCSWIASPRALQPRTVFAARKLRDELGTLLRELSIAIVEPSLTSGAAHVH
ncbi:helix-turn-helix domain-containing protein [Caulobacter sp. DWR1-3-2b1]|uniref:helix-turn-helix domain-containing protein n=1 Tax=Caulobacter sp. DWR1-3-2b1 TaxID=2804670 RepID=UPI003CED6D87